MAGVPYHRLAAGSVVPTGLDVRLTVQLAALVELVERLRPSVLHAASDYRNALLASAAGRAFGLPVVYEVRGFWEETWRATAGPGAERSQRYVLLRARETACARAAAAVVTLGETMAGRLASRGVARQRIHVLANGVDTAAFVPQPRDVALAGALRIADDDTVIGYISTLNRYEGVEDPLKAVAALGAAGRRVIALVVGDGPDRERLERLAVDFGVASRVRFAGRVPHRDVARHYSVIDVFVVPRTSDAVSRLVPPLKPLEAMAAGKPLVVSDVEALRELVVEGKTGVTFDAGDSASLAAVLETLVDDPSRRARLGASARRWVSRHRTWDQIGRRYADLYPQPDRRARVARSHKRSESLMRVMLVAGARPNFMKVAPIIDALVRDGSPHMLVHTGQHYDARMSDAFFADLELADPDHHLGVGSGTHAQQTARVMEAFEPVLLDAQPDWLVVVGDVNSTLACALVAAKVKDAVGCRIAHVEAGLRSHDWRMPEEVNRVLTDRLSDLLLLPSRDALDNLVAEGIPPSRAVMTGNVMIDTLHAQLPAAREADLPGRLGLGRRRYAVTTLHRPSNVDDRDTLAVTLGALVEVARVVPVVLPVHPRTRKNVEAFGLGGLLEPLRVIEPLGYRDMLSLTDGAAAVFTDSGGLQEETTALGIPCLTLREQTERPVTITEGTNRLAPWPPTHDALVACGLAALAEGRREPGTRVPEGWDGHASERVVPALHALTTNERADEFESVAATPPSTPARGWIYER